MENKEYATIKPEFLETYLLTLNTETGLFEDAYWAMKTVWPFEVNKDGWHNIGNKYYYKTFDGYYISEKALCYIDEKTYKEMILERECAGDESIARSLEPNMDPKELGEELIRAFCNKIYNFRADWSSHYCDFIDKCIRGVAKAEISVMWADYDEETKEIKIHVSLGKPGFFIGRCGEIIDFWSARIRQFLKWYNPEYKFTFRLQEFAQINYRESKIRL